MGQPSQLLKTGWISPVHLASVQCCILKSDSNTSGGSLWLLKGKHVQCQRLDSIGRAPMAQTFACIVVCTPVTKGMALQCCTKTENLQIFFLNSVIRDCSHVVTLSTHHLAKTSFPISFGLLSCIISDAFAGSLLAHLYDSYNPLKGLDPSFGNQCSIHPQSS